MLFGNKSNNFNTAELAAIRNSQAVIYFEPDGTIIEANNNFLKAMGYTLEEIQGKHHSMFVETEEKKSDEYKNFWGQLKQGQFQAKQFKRIAKNGKEV